MLYGQAVIRKAWEWLRSNPRLVLAAIAGVAAILVVSVTTQGLGPVGVAGTIIGVLYGMLIASESAKAEKRRGRRD